MSSPSISTLQCSPSIAELTKALNRFHKACPKIPKSSRNPFLKSKYADLASILDVIQPVLNECDLVVQQHPTSDYGLTTIISHVSGEWMSSEYRMQPLESVIEKANPQAGTAAQRGVTPQSIGSVITYQRRYAIGAILNLNIDDDTDANPPGAMDSGTTSEPAAPKLSAKELMAQAAAKVAPATATTEPAAEITASTSATAATVDQPGNGLEITQGQRELIEKLFAACQITPAQQLEVHQKRGLQTLRSYSYEQAGELIGKLETKLAGMQAQQSQQANVSPLVDTTGGQSLSGQTSLNITQPGTASAEQVKSIKDAVEEWAQSQPGIADDFIARLTASGVGKLANLSFAQASDLLAAVQVRNIANFFERSLQTTS